MESSAAVWYLKKRISLRQGVCLEHSGLLCSLVVRGHSREVTIRRHFSERVAEYLALVTRAS